MPTPLPFDYELERERLLRRRKVAEAMMLQSQQPLGDTQFVGGLAVRRSPLEGVAKVAQALGAQYQAKQVDEEAKGLAQRQRDDIASAIEDYQKAITPRSESRSTIVDELANEGAGGQAEITAPAYNPSPTDKQAAALALMGRVGNPGDAAKAMVAAALKSPADSLAKIDPKDYTPESFAQYLSTNNPAALRPRVKMESVSLGGSTQFVDPYNPPGAPLAHTPAPQGATEIERELLAAGMQRGSPQWNAAMQNRIAKQTTHQPPIANISVSTEKKYGEQFGGLMAKADLEMRDSALKAPDLAERANRVKEVIASGKVITGAGADVRLAVGKALNLAGATDAETIKNTEVLATDLASNTLDSIKASGLGGGTGFSNADRDFLEKAKGGKITLEAGTISRLADLAHKAASNSAKSWNDRLVDIPDEPAKAVGLRKVPVQVPPLYTAGPAAKGDRLTPAERAELEALRKRFPGASPR